MKSHAIRHIWTSLAATAVFLWSSSITYAQTDSIGIGVPEKDAAGELQIHKIDLVIQVDSALPISFDVTQPGAGSSTTFGPFIPDSGTSVNLIGGDLITIISPDASLNANDPRRRNYTFRINPSSDYDTTSCTETMSGDETWQIAVNGGQNRFINACIVSFDRNTATVCEGGERVIPSTDPNQIATVSGLNAAEQTCRFGLEAMLSLDRSGSMSGRARPAEPSGPGNQKIVSLRDAVETFNNALETVRSTETTIGLTLPADEIGVVTFNSNAQDLPGISPGLNAFDPTLANTIETQLDMVGAAGSTSIGDGLISAATSLGSADPDKRRFILSMSDGKQNTAQRVSVHPTTGEILTHTSSTACAGGSADPACDLLPNDGTFSVCSVTVGTSTAVDPAINQAVALAGDCFYLNSEDDASEMSTFFLSVLQNFLEAGSWQTLVAGPGVAGQVQGSPLTVPVTTTSSAMSITLAPQAGDFLCMSVAAPGQPPGDQICDSSPISFGRAVTQMAAGHMGGDWVIDIWAPRSSPNKPANFYLMVLADDLGTHSSIDIQATEYAPAEPIAVRVKLEEFQEPLVGLAGPDVNLRLGEPLITVGELMEGADPSTGGVPEGSASDDSAVAVENAVNSDPSVVLDDETTILLAEVEPGIYEAQFNIGNYGHSDLLISITGDAPGGGKFTRQIRKTLFIRAVPDEDETDIETSIDSNSGTAGGGTVAIQMTPRTITGDPIGTGFGNYIWLQGPGIAPFKLNDNLNGTYSRTINYTGATPPDLSVHFMPDTVSISDDVPPERLPVPLDESTTLTTIEPYERGPWSIDAHFGLTSPQGSTGSAFDGDVAYGLTLEYGFNNIWAAELYAGQDSFEGSGSGADLDVTRFSISGKAYFTPSPYRFYAGAGYGSYDFSPGPAENGINAMLGLQWDNWQRTSLDGRIEYHSVDTSGSSFDYYSFMIGLKYHY